MFMYISLYVDIDIHIIHLFISPQLYIHMGHCFEYNLEVQVFGTLSIAAILEAAPTRKA